MNDAAWQVQIVHGFHTVWEDLYSGFPNAQHEVIEFVEGELTPLQSWGIFPSASDFST